MLDHLMGKPSANWRRTQAILLLLGGYQMSKVCHRYNFGNAFVVKWNQTLEKYSPLQIILFTLMAVHSVKNGFLLLGLQGPEPLAHLYNHNFFRASWILTALDAGFWTAMPIRPKFLRDICSLLFGFFYLFFPEAADTKVRKYRATVTVEAMRISWQKQLNPVFWAVGALSRPWFGVRRQVLIPRPNRDSLGEEPIVAYLYFIGSEEELHQCKSLIFSVPGGGFVTMGPPCHESYMAFWCKETRTPILSLDYKKAPEYPYPYALHECFDAYRTVVETRGQCIGLEGLKITPIQHESGHHLEIPIALVGDSAGGNLATAMMYRILEFGPQLARPQGLVLIYPCLNFNITSWMSPGQIKMFRNQSVKSLASLWEAKAHYKHKSPLATFSDTDDDSHWPKIQRRQPSIEEQVRISSTTPNGLHHNTREDYIGELMNRTQLSGRNKSHQLTMTSRMTYFNDRVLTPDLMRVMAILYLGPHNQPDFHSDYYLSPIVGPEHLLAQFPKTYLICGEVDPMVDDTILFAGRIRQAKLKASRRSRRSSINHMTNMGLTVPQQPKSLFALTPLVDKKKGSNSKDKTEGLKSQGGGSITNSFVIGDDDDDESSDMFSQPSDNEDDSADNNITLPENDSSANNLLAPVESYARLYPTLPSNPNLSASYPTVDRLNSSHPEFNINGEEDPGQLGVEVRLLSGMSHAFLSMIPFLPEAQSSTKYIASWFVDILSTNEQAPAADQ